MFNFSDLKYKIKSPTPVKDKKISKPEIIEGKDNLELSIKDKKVCNICNFTCPGERGLRLVYFQIYLDSAHYIL